MKRYSRVVAFVLLGLVSLVSGLVQEVNGRSGNIASDFSGQGTASTLSAGSNLFDFTAVQESNPLIIHPLYPEYQKHPSEGQRMCETDRSNGLHNISDYLFFAGCQIDRFENADLIFPYFYSW